MEDENSQFLSSQTFDESIVNSVNSKNWIWKYFKVENVFETSHINSKYGICNVNNESDKRCNARFKVSGRSTSNLIYHLLRSH
ncbi:7487_t:CDS:1, partial [Cetraspora pellucida]